MTRSAIFLSRTSLCDIFTLVLQWLSTLYFGHPSSKKRISIVIEVGFFYANMEFLIITNKVNQTIESAYIIFLVIYIQFMFV